MEYSFLTSGRNFLLSIEDKADRNTVIDNIITLRAALSDKNKGIPEKKISGNLVLGTWSLREFGGRHYEGRMTEALYYIAEIISRYDLVILQDVKDDHKELNSLCHILGDNWGLFTGLETARASNGQHWLAYFYDKRKVKFSNIVAHFSLPHKEGRACIADPAWLLRFQSGCFQFDVCLLHIGRGAAGHSELYQRRAGEIADLVHQIKQDYIEKEAFNNLFIFGDFDVPHRHSETYKIINASVFRIPEAVLNDNLPSNTGPVRSRDQIIYYNRFKDVTFRKAGTFNYYDVVFDNYRTYAKRARKHAAKVTTPKAFDDFKTYQMSDHLPLWIEMNTDYAENHLEMLKVQD